MWKFASLLKLFFSCLPPLGLPSSLGEAAQLPAWLAYHVPGSYPKMNKWVGFPVASVSLFPWFP